MLSEYQNNVFYPYVCFLFQRHYRLKGEKGSQLYSDWISLEMVLVPLCQRVFQVTLCYSHRIYFICMVFILIAPLQCIHMPYCSSIYSVRISGFSIFTELCNHHHHLNFVTFSSSPPQRNLSTLPFV